MNWFVFWIIIYLVVIAWFAFRHVRKGDIDNYLVNNRNTGTISLVLLMGMLIKNKFYDPKRN